MPRWTLANRRVGVRFTTALQAALRRSVRRVRSPHHPFFSMATVIGIRDSQGKAVVAECSLSDTVREALAKLNRARPSMWPAIDAAQLCMYPGGWAVPLDTEVAGGLVLPLAGFMTQPGPGPEFYFFSPSSLGSGSGGYEPPATVTMSAPAPTASASPSTSSAPPPAAPKPKSGPTLPIALVFPGQGSQSVGMLKKQMSIPAVAAMFAKAKTILGYDLQALIADGPIEKLTETKYCQPAMFIAGLAAVEQLRLDDPASVDGCRATAGLSLGEYTALTFAGALSFEDGLKLVNLRANAMQEAATMGRKGKMLSVVGMEKDALQQCCEEVRAKLGGDTVCQIANELFPKGNVAAGHAEAIDMLKPLAKSKGALSAAEPKTSGGFHSPLMAPAGEKLKAALAATPISFPEQVQVYSNVAGRPYTSAAEILELLGQQLTSPVLWNGSVAKMRSDGIEKYFEVGPQTQLRSMMRRMDPKLFQATVSVNVA